MKSRTRIVVGIGVTLVVGVVAVLALNRVAQPSAAVQDSAPPATPGREFATVETRSLSDSKEFNAEVTYGEQWTLPLTVQGTVTRRNTQGTVIEPGQPIIWINDRPVILASGEVPLYRELKRETIRRPGMKAAPLSGADVKQLQEFLIAGGYTADNKLEANGVFDRATQTGVKAWQEANNLDQTGIVTNTQLVFLPTNVRIQSEPRVGGAFESITVTNPEQEIVVTTSRRDAGYLETGSTVEIGLGADAPVTGKVTETKDVRNSDGGGSSVQVTVTATRPLPADAQRVTVTGSGDSVENALTVPVRSLVALAEGGYAVEVQTQGSGTELRRVEIGDIIEGFAVVAGDVNEGDKIVVPQ